MHPNSWWRCQLISRCTHPQSATQETELDKWPTYEEYQGGRKNAAKHRQEDALRGDVLLAEVAEDGDAKPLEDVEDVEEAGDDLREVTHHVLPTDRRCPATVSNTG